jgi:Fe-S-cluster containining protein
MTANGASYPPEVAPVYSLSIHADYQCQHSGVCCTSDWDVPVELPVYRTLDEAMTAGQLIVPGTPADGTAVLMREALPEDAAAMVARTRHGDCVFYHRGSGLCVVHRDLGEPTLPSTCRHFPRVAVRDQRGTFISLTHYCPTAASMLFRDDVPLQIVEGPAAFPPAAYDGLVVDPEAWPPLLHPQMLMDLDGYTAWERHMVRRCADPFASPESILATLARDARTLRTFTPGTRSLIDAIAALPNGIVTAPPARSLGDSLDLYAGVVAAIPDELKPAADEEGLADAFERQVAPSWAEWRAPLSRYLAAKAFASWTAYQGRGLLTIVRGLEAALALVRVETARQCRDTGRAVDAELLREGIRGADFFLNHLALGEELAEGWSKAEDLHPIGA